MITSRCLNCGAGNTMKLVESKKALTTEYICTNCGTKLVTTYKEIDRVFSVVKTERWYRVTGNFLFKTIEYDKFGKVINAENCKEKEFKIEVGISESDIELFKDLVYENKKFNWVFSSENDNAKIILNFTQEDE